jgi:hypothetical protein
MQYIPFYIKAGYVSMAGFSVAIFFVNIVIKRMRATTNGCQIVLEK